MSSTRVGRNDPCPCNSGKKFKKCCIHLKAVEDAPRPEPHHTGAPDDLAAINAQVDKMMHGHNSEPQSELAGLSPNQMHKLLEGELSPASGMQWKKNIESHLHLSPAFKVAECLLRALDDGPVKLTAAGYLPPAIVIPAAAEITEYLSASELSIRPVKKEADCRAIQITRFLLTESGVIQEKKGRLHRVKALANMSDGDLFKKLFLTHAFEFNWASEDGYGEGLEIQGLSLFFVRLVQQQPHEINAASVANHLCMVYPHLLEMMPETHYSTSEAQFISAFELRVLNRFFTFFGLLKGHRAFREITQRYTQTPLLKGVFNSSP